MIIVADASVLVAELLRHRGRVLLTDPGLDLVVAEEQWNETEHEIARRLDIIVGQGRMSAEQAEKLSRQISSLRTERSIEVIPRGFYEHVEIAARRRVPRDPRDWPTVALAMVLDVPILTGDNDFLGCGCPTWTVETLTEELKER